MDRIIRVDMKDRKISEESMPLDYLNFGGRALTSRLVSAEVPPSCEPFGKKNKCFLATGPFAGTSFPCSGRLSIGGKSPLTGGIKESNVGGTAAWKLSRLGIRCLILEGLPSSGKDLFILRLSKEQNNLVDASKFEKMKTYELVKKLKAQFGENTSIIAIGPAGEMKLSAAGVAVTDIDGNPCDYAGRGGMGAVMGSKRIKAIIIDDTGAEKEHEYFDRKKFVDISKEYTKKLLNTKKELHKYGTPIEIAMSNELGYLPTRNYQNGRFEKADMISGEMMHDLIQKRGGKSGTACMPGCPIRCKQTFIDNKREYLTSSLEYETIVMLGSNCGIDDLDSIAMMDRKCDELGIDTMEIGAAIAVAMEAKIIEFGDTNGVFSLLHEIEVGSPLGRVLGNGAGVTGKVFGVERVPVVKGQSLAGYDPRSNKGMGVTYMSSPMGADHTAGCVIPGRKGFDTQKDYDLLKKDGQEELSVDLQIMVSAIDGMGVCFFAGVDVEMLKTLTKLYNAKFGTNVSVDEIVQTAKDTIALEHRFNLESGLPMVQNLPEFFTNEPLSPHRSLFDVNKKVINSAMIRQLKLKGGSK